MPNRNLSNTLTRTAVGLGGAGLAGATVGAAVLAWGWQRWQQKRRPDWSGKVVLVTGGSRGLGFAIAREFAACGARVAIAARDPDELHRAHAKLAAHASGSDAVVHFASDLRAPAAPAALLASVREHWGRVDVLVHNAGVMQLGPWDQMTDADFSEAMDVHFWAALRLARAVLPEMIARGSGRIVNISSIGGLLAVPHMLPYTTSKFALVGLSQGLASEVRRHGVRVTCVCPFLTRTGSQERVRIRGQHAQEYAWFATSGSLPGLSQSAAHVARTIVRIAERGPAQVTLALPGKLAALAHGVSPAAVTTLLAQVDRFLPQPQAGTGAEARSGRESYSPFTVRLVRPLVHRAGSKLNQT
ncbi:MAG: SDR family NAD(P)-dependent oxidoreductase [Terriglobales bacterium]